MIRMEYASHFQVSQTLGLISCIRNSSPSFCDFGIKYRLGNAITLVFSILGLFLKELE